MIFVATTRHVNYRHSHYNKSSGKSILVELTWTIQTALDWYRGTVFTTPMWIEQTKACECSNANSWHKTPVNNGVAARLLPNLFYRIICYAV